MDFSDFNLLGAEEKANAKWGAKIYAMIYHF